MFPLSRQAAERAAEDAAKPTVLPHRLARAAGAERGRTPYEVVHEENKVRVRRYDPDEHRFDVPVVMAYAFVNDPSILDLQADRSVVRGFLDRGFRVYVIDWGRPSLLDHSLTLSDYVVRYLDNCVDAARGDANAERVHLLGYSTGAPLAVAYAALFPGKVRTLLLQGPPLSFDAEEGMFAFREASVDPDLLVERFGNLPAELVDLGFSLRKPVEYTAGTVASAWDDLADADEVEHDVRKMEWAADGPDLAGATYRQFVDDLLDDDALLSGDLELDGRRVDLSNVVMPVLLILGRDDEFVPASASLPALDAVVSEDTGVVEFPTGHVGLSVAPEAHEEGWPQVHDWLAERS